MISTIFCDIGGVLLEIDPEQTVAVWAEKTGVDADRIRSRFPLQLHHRYERGELTDHEFYTALIQTLGLPELSMDDFQRGWRALIGKETGFWSFMRQAAPALPIWLLSNTNTLHISNGLKQRCSFFADADGSIFSYEVRRRKPEAGIFLAACKTAGVTPEKALFIDDVEENIFAAQTLGFHTIHYQDLESGKKEFLNKVCLP